jgi:hypothetical protein
MDLINSFRRADSEVIHRRKSFIRDRYNHAAGVLYVHAAHRSRVDLLLVTRLLILDVDAFSIIAILMSIRMSEDVGTP